MRKIRFAFVLAIVAVLLVVLGFSQIAPTITTKTTQITPSISLEEKETCTTTSYEEKKDIIEDCVYYHNYTICLNTTGTNTDCSLKQSTRIFQCKTGENIVTKNKTDCIPNNEFIISVEQDRALLKKRIDFSDWGPCIYTEENGCLIVTCVSYNDGAHNGKFTDCKGGKSCQRFEICGNSVKTLYKNSRDDFVEYDESFYLPALEVKEVGQ